MATTPRLWLSDRPPSSADSSPAVARAIAELRQVATEAKLTATVQSSDASQVSVRVVDTSGGALTVFVERARAEGKYYRREGRLGLWYGADVRPPWMASLLQSVAALLPGWSALADELPEKTSAERPSVPGPAEVERFFHVDYRYEGGVEVDQPPTTRIGVIYQCNQPCTFCQLANMNTHIPPARIHAALEASRSRGAERVIFTGGEPTMCAQLPEYLSRARELGYRVIELQTNATLLDRPGRAAELRKAGLTDAQVSLHGPDGEISDRLTAAPGTHARTLDGIGRLLDAGVRVLLNHLVFRDNAHLLLDFVELVDRRYGQHRERVTLQFHSPLHEFANDELARAHIARYSEYATSLRQAIDRGWALGFQVRDLQDPTGIPALCVLGADATYLGRIRSQREKPRLHEWEVSGMTRVAACSSCELADACMGIPKRYVELHGDQEFRPLSLAQSTGSRTPSAAASSSENTQGGSGTESSS